MKCPFRKIIITKTKPLYNCDGERGSESETTEYFAECDGAACVAWDCGACMKLEEN